VTPGGSGVEDLAFSYGAMGAADFFVTEHLFVGFAPRYFVHVKNTTAVGYADEEWMPLRLGYSAEVMPRLRIFGYVAAGDSIVYPPASGYIAAGTGWGVGGGATFALTPRLRGFVDVDYQYGLESGTFENTLVDMQFAFLSVSAGLSFGAM
jgi:hypothetical protein